MGYTVYEVARVNKRLVFALRRDNWAIPIGYCAEKYECIACHGHAFMWPDDRACTGCDGSGKIANTCGGHDSHEEAQRCYYDWTLDHLQTDKEYQHSAPCTVCNTRIGVLYYGVGPVEAHQTRPQPLCEEHRTRAIYESIQPFTPGLSIIRR